MLTLSEIGIQPRGGAAPAASLEPGFKPVPGDALLVIDVQNDFIPGGALEVAEGHEVVPVCNALMERFDVVVFSQDWHCPGHESFASSHQGKSPYDSIQMPYGDQTLWPDHCVQDTSEDDFRTCNKKYGGVMAWTGQGESDQQGWQCYCNWPQYSATNNCVELNPNICGGKGTLDWDATQGQSPEKIACKCDDGYVGMRSLEGKPEICVLDKNKTFYLGLYEEI